LAELIDNYDFVMEYYKEVKDEENEEKELLASKYQEVKEILPQLPFVCQEGEELIKQYDAAK